MGVSVQAADLFGHGPEGPTPSLSAEAHSPLPEPLRTVLGQMVSLQSQLNAQLRGQLRQARDGGSLSPVLAIIGLSFLYGVVHALGPGHGKLVVGSYFLSRRARLVHGLMMSGTAALVQALSAIALVSLLALVFDFGSQEIFAQAGTLETLSYFGITAVGLAMLWRVWQQKDCCHG
ncbi:MAG TPA: high frequency lysogenization protein HflD, partial [Rhodospirillaceae bacterium]|nr:high frequency lysogenization protein HflD [Rhodospirillaceae bacterium]